jgi:soluble lytic murein transglycosylase
VSSRTSIGSARADAARSRRRSSERRGKRRTRKPRFARLRRVRGVKRTVVILATVAVGAVAGVFLANSDPVQNTLLEVTLPLRHDDIIRQQAAEKGVPADLIAAVIYTESRFQDQTSSAGARGLMQITPETANVIEKLSGGQTFEFEDLSDPDLNIRYGTFYLRYLINKFGGNQVAALAAYNAGETNVTAWGGSSLGLEDIQFDETRDYVEKVLEKRADYAENYADALGLTGANGPGGEAGRR